jgi:hypothetical protein
LLELPDDLFDALHATLPSREDRDLDAGLRRRRGSLHYKRTGSLADVAELLGDSKRVAADHYVYALTDYREVDRTIALARAAPG